MQESEIPDGPRLVYRLLNQVCSVVRPSTGGQLVLGFGTPSLAEWPLRRTFNATWLLYSRYGSWRVLAEADLIASDDDPGVAREFEDLRPLLLGRRVEQVVVKATARSLTLELGAGLTVSMGPGSETRGGESAWDLVSESGTVEAVERGLVVSRPEQRDVGEAALVHRYLRSVAGQVGLHLFEPSPRDLQQTESDAVLVTPAGLIVLVEFRRPRGEVHFFLWPATGQSPRRARQLAFEDVTEESVRDAVVDVARAA